MGPPVQRLQEKVAELKADIKHKTGVAIEPWAADSVRQVFEALNLSYPKTDAGAASFTKQYLNAHPHEVCQQIVKLREFDKADSTFIDSILRHSHKGRIHDHVNHKCDLYPMNACENVSRGTALMSANNIICSTSSCRIDGGQRDDRQACGHHPRHYPQSHRP